MIKGTAASGGIAIGRALVVEEKSIDIEKKVVEADKEIIRFRQAVEVSKLQLIKIKNIAEKKLGKSKAAIFEAHIMLLDDPEYTGAVENKICSERVNSEYALNEITLMFVSIFENMDNEYMKERSSDIKDVAGRLTKNLVGIDDISLLSFEGERIVVARDITPSDTAQMDKERVLGFAVEIGGRTSHSAIMAKSMEIPAVVGIGSINEIKNGDMLIIDGDNGILIVNPDKEEIKVYEEKRNKIILEKSRLKDLKDANSDTVDGKNVLLAANIGSNRNIESVLENGADGIGLFRTEFLYMEGEKAPTEEQQFKAYKEVLTAMGKKPVIIRTLDIGGDKKLPYIQIKNEENPFLGCRAIRLCLDRKDIFKVQLRALYRAAAYGNLKIMFPMISSLQELLQAKAVALEAKSELKEENVPFGEAQLGIMIEVPSAAIISDVLAQEADFFSIGTNDLIQYTIAVDRTNERISYLYDSFHPAILRLIKLVIDNAHNRGIHVGMCGEMAADPLIIPILLGMGLDEFSMSPSTILNARRLVRGLIYEDMIKHSKEVMKLKSSEEIKQYMRMLKIF